MAKEKGEGADESLLAAVEAQPGTVARLDPVTGKWRPYPREVVEGPQAITAQVQRKGGGLSRLVAARRKK